jgi:hypothetical protein
MADDERSPGLTDGDAAHMTVNYKSPEGDNVTRIYAIGMDLVREDRKIPYKEFLTGRELNQLLLDRDCKLDCSTGPAVVEHRADGSTYEEYRRDGKMHREGAPAQIERGSDGSVVLEEYFLHGERVLRAVQTKEAEAERVTAESRAEIPQRDTRRARDRELDELIKQQDEKQKAKEQERVPERHMPDRDR